MQFLSVKWTERQVQILTRKTIRSYLNDAAREYFWSSERSTRDEWDGGDCIKVRVHALDWLVPVVQHFNAWTARESAPTRSVFPAYTTKICLLCSLCFWNKKGLRANSWYDKAKKDAQSNRLFLIDFQPSKEEEERRRIRRERNKIAAAKCRNRRRELIDTLQAVSMPFYGIIKSEFLQHMHG